MPSKGMLSKNESRFGKDQIIVFAWLTMRKNLFACTETYNDIRINVNASSDIVNVQWALVLCVYANMCTKA